MIEHIFAIPLAADLAMLLTEVARLKSRPRRGGCRYCVILVTKSPDPKFAGWVDAVAVDEPMELGWARVVVNRYGGKSGAIVTALEDLDCEAYVFVDDDVEPGEWIRELGEASCVAPSTVYRWIKRSLLSNAFSLGAVDWLTLVPFLWGGGMGFPARYRARVVEALRGCEIDDLAVTSVIDKPQFIYTLVESDPPRSFTEFAVRQAASARWGSPRLWAIEAAYYSLWTASLVAASLTNPLVAAAMLAVHAVRQMLRAWKAGENATRGLTIVGWDRAVMATVFLLAGFVKRVRWRGRVVDLSKCTQHLRYTRTKFSKAAALA